ncbi:hypothetical protein IT40_00715 [Paracoccus versutus]|nr:hypothetical protein IT40_00715 [Paracoccus versutus]
MRSIFVEGKQIGARRQKKRVYWTHLFSIDVECRSPKQLVIGDPEMPDQIATQARSSGPIQAVQLVYNHDRSGLPAAGMVLRECVANKFRQIGATCWRDF